MLEWPWVLLDVTENNSVGHYHFLVIGLWLFSLLAFFIHPSDMDHPLSSASFSQSLGLAQVSRWLYIKHAFLYTLFYWALISLWFFLDLGGCVLGMSIFISLAVFLIFTYPRLLLLFVTGLSLFDHKEAKLGEIILFDVLCSFSRIPWISLLHAKALLGEPRLENPLFLMAYYCLLFPFLVRLKQCCLNGGDGFAFQFQLNACKYTISMMAIIFSTIDNPSSSAGHADHYYYSGEILTGWTLCLLALSFLFNFSWDLLVDWHILHIQWIPKRFSYQISFKKPLFIPSMILAVFALFNFWVRLLPFSRYIQGPLYISGISLSTHLYVGLEILRRWIWTFLRLQSHLENTFNYFELDQAHSTSSNNTQICPENLPLDCDENISDIINS